MCKKLWKEKNTDPKAESRFKGQKELKSKKISFFSRLAAENQKLKLFYHSAGAPPG